MSGVMTVNLEERLTALEAQVAALTYHLEGRFGPGIVSPVPAPDPPEASAEEQPPEQIPPEEPPPPEHTPHPDDDDDVVF